MKTYLVTIKFGSGKTAERLCKSRTIYAAILDTLAELSLEDNTVIVSIEAERQEEA